MLRRLVARLSFASILSAKTGRATAEWLLNICCVAMQTGSLAELCRWHWFQIQSSECDIIWFVCMWQESSVECGAGCEKSVFRYKFMTFLVPATAIRNMHLSAIVSNHGFGSVAEWVAMCNLAVTVAVDRFEKCGVTQILGWAPFVGWWCAQLAPYLDVLVVSNT